MLREYDIVTLKQGGTIPLPSGTKGTVLVVHHSPTRAYEVEFVDKAGTSLGTFTVEEGNLERVPSAPLTANRSSLSRIILWCGCAVLLWGFSGAIYESVSRTQGIGEFDFGIVLGFGAHMIIGVIAILTARCLIRIEERLDT